MAHRPMIEHLAARCRLPLAAVEATVELLEAGYAAPFLARYRQERTGGLKEDHIRELAAALHDLTRLQKRKATLLQRLADQGALTDELRSRIQDVLNRDELEDLYLAHRPKRRTRGALAAERGLAPLAQALPAPPAQAASLEELAAPFVRPERSVPDAAAALDGARHILAEQVAEDPEVRRRLRQLYRQRGIIRSRVVEAKRGQPSKYEMYYDFTEAVESIPSHRVLAIRRGEKEGWLEARVEVDRTAALAILRDGRLPPPEAPTAGAVEAALTDAFDRLLAPAFDSAIRSDLKRRADAEAIRMFSRNLRTLLLQPPAGPRRTAGIEPGYRTGCKLAALDEHGRLLAHVVIFPHPPQSQQEEAATALRSLVETHRIEAIAVGNGTAARETDLFIRQLFRQRPGPRPVCMVVNAAAAAAQAQSRDARDEFPHLDPALRAAVSIARRFQDPLTELAQVDPKLIGVGQYQHDVNQQALRTALEAVVESCVNAVGVDPNRAPATVLAHVAGFDRATAHEVVGHHEAHGPFRTRAELNAVARVTPQRFEQAAPFLRIRGGPQPLDATAIHPEHYPLVERLAAEAGTDVPGLLAHPDTLKDLDLSRFAGEDVGEPTLALIRRELLRPGRDPRPPFRRVEFRDDLTDLAQLRPGMILEGVVTNVTNFGAFVDIGVQENGLVHVSEIAHRFVRDPNEAVHVGQIVRAKVLAVDTERRRISLSLKQARPPRRRQPRPRRQDTPQQAPADKAPPKKGKGAKGRARSKPARPPNAPATAEDIARLIAHFEKR